MATAPRKRWLEALGPGCKPRPATKPWEHGAVGGAYRVSPFAQGRGVCRWLQCGSGRQHATPGPPMGSGHPPAQQESQAGGAGPSWTPRLVQSAFEAVQTNERHKPLALLVTWVPGRSKRNPGPTVHLGEAKGAEARDRQESRPVTGTRLLQKLSMDTARFPGPQVPSSVVMCRQLPSVGRWLYPVTPRPQSRPPLSASGRPGTDAAAPSPPPGHLAQEAQNPAGR